MVYRSQKQDRLPHDCMDAGGRATQEQLPRDAAVERTRMYSPRVLFWDLCTMSETYR